MDVGPVGGRGYRDGKIVNVGDSKRPEGFQVQGGDVYDEQEGGDGRTLRDPDRYGSEMAGGPLERQAAGAVPEERTDPLDQVWANPFSAEERKE